jgi:hypothetical protein
MKARLSEFGYIIWLCVLCLVAITVLAFGGLAIQKYVYPWWLSIQRTSVEASKSFTDANNNMLETYKLEYSRLDTKIAEAGDNTDITKVYVAQQKAVVEKMCREISTMNRSTVNPTTLQWLNSKGACK